MKKFLVLFLLICSVVSAQPATPKYGQNIPPGGVLGFYPDNGKFYALPVNASGALLVDSGEVPLWELNASGVVETLDDRAIDALSLRLSSDGTAAAPAISFGPDPDTGIYRYGENSIGFSANGNSICKYWYNAGSGYIAAPTEDGSDGRSLELCGGGGGSTNRGAVIGLLGNDIDVVGGIANINAGNVPTGDITFSTQALERLRIKYSGNVLIGTTTDDAKSKLQVNGSMRLVGGAEPGTPTEGSIYFNSTSKHFYGYNGTAWIQLDN